MSAAELLDLGSKPIREDAPGGDSARDEPEFEAIQEEVRKLELPTLPEVDWGLVVGNARTLLETKSKDILVAAWLAVGLYEREGYAGLAAGLTVMRDLVSQHWEHLQPGMKRMRGRVAALEWLGERGAQRVKMEGAKTGSPEELKTCLERVGEIGEALAPKVDDGATLLSELRRALDDISKRQAPPPPPPRAASAPGATSAASMGSVSSPEDANKALTEIRRLALGAAGVLRDTDIQNPLAYRLPRQIIWGRVTQGPPATDGQTQIPSAGEAKAEFEAALGRGEWKGVLLQAEEKLATALFWLDIHRYSVTALEKMGEEFAPAADAICEELGLLLKRVPELPNLRFADGSPLADGSTRQWIQSRVASSLGGGEAAAPAPAAAPAGDDPGLDGFEEAVEEARELARKKRLGEALRRLEEGASRAGLFRARARWKLEMARLCLDRGQVPAAEALLENLDREMTGSTYEDWGPELAADVLKTLLLCRKKAGRPPSPEEAERNREILNRLCRIDVFAALDAEGR